MKPLFVFLMLLPSLGLADGPDHIQVSKCGKGFVYAGSNKPFVPWGFNYDHDESGRLIEDYWEKEWAKVEEDFREMKSLGANVVRIHLQFGRFMKSADVPHESALVQLDRLVRLAELLGLYLDLTGLGCYHKPDVPDWYDKLDERGRWDAQARFWEAIARRCERSPAIFCYNLMNEPVVPRGRRKAGDWLGPAFGGKHFVQFISLDPSDRPRAEVARNWISHLVASIRKHDKRHLVTVGLVDWSLDRPGLTSGFEPEKVAGELDFLAVHLYPESGKLDDAAETLKGFAIGKPVIIEETFPLKCTSEELAKFMDESKASVSGWIGFYWGKMPDECRRSDMPADALLLSWLELFQKRSPTGADAPKELPNPLLPRP